MSAMTEQPQGPGDAAVALGGVAVVAAGVVVAVVLDKPWSWPLFVWGAALGVVAAGYAYSSTRYFGRRLERRASGPEREVLARRGAELWPRFRATYVSLALSGVGFGILAAGMRSVTLDVALTIAWVVIGVLLPLLAFAVALRHRT